jgi:predicted nucleotidyltransferase
LIPNDNIVDPLLKEILGHVNRAAIPLGIDFYVAGAVARDYHLSKMPDYIPSRRTRDLDVAVMVADEEQFIQLKKALLDTSLFQEHTEPIKLIYKDVIELDLLPFGEIEEAGIIRLTKPKIFTLDMPGFTLLNDFTEIVQWDEKLKAKICALEGIILLKLIAYNDKPYRTKDLTDIQQIIKHYFDISSDDIYENHFDLMELYDTNDRDYIPKLCAHVIGRKLKVMLNTDVQLHERIKRILKSTEQSFWGNIFQGLL